MSRGKSNIVIKAAQEVFDGKLKGNQAARKYNVSPSAIRTRLRKMGVEPKKPGRPIIHGRYVK